MQRVKGSMFRHFCHLLITCNKFALDPDKDLQNVSPDLDPDRLPLCQIYEPVHEISNNVVCAASKAFDQSAHMLSLIRAFASRLSIL